VRAGIIETEKLIYPVFVFLVEDEEEFLLKKA
jgi:hypothetical protein